MDDNIENNTSSTYPFIKCPNCHGYGTLGFKRVLCPTCLGKGVIRIDIPDRKDEPQK